jgi:hypothetical protein
MERGQPLTKAFGRLRKRLGIDEREQGESWARESGQVDKWIFCLTTARLAEDQEIR